MYRAIGGATPEKILKFYIQNGAFLCIQRAVECYEAGRYCCLNFVKKKLQQKLLSIVIARLCCTLVLDTMKQTTKTLKLKHCTIRLDRVASIRNVKEEL